ncbi:MAG: hypothetical protein IJ333_02450 [Clostridia bacterium]|nr:hypothetical protein [Clostridia bacterium]
MRKKLSLVLIVVIAFTIVLVCSLLSGETDDIWYGTMDVVLTLFLLVPLVFTEISIYHNCIYFFTEKTKKTSKTILNILMCFTSIALLTAIFVSTFHFNKNHEILIVTLFLASVALRVVYFIMKKGFRAIKK